MTLKDCKARYAKLRRDNARFMAQRILDAQKLNLPKLLKAPKLSAKERRELLEAIADWSTCLVTHIDEPALFLGMVVLELKGKLRDKSDDDLVIKAFWHAMRKASGRVPTPKQIDNALTVLSGRNRRPTLRAAVRRLKQHGLL
jgi:hypothetical protein